MTHNPLILLSILTQHGVYSKTLLGGFMLIQLQFVLTAALLGSLSNSNAFADQSLCKHTGNPDTRCCTVDLTPTWWCPSENLQITSSCKIGKQNAVIWSCKQPAQPPKKDNPPTQTLPPSSGPLPKAICENSFLAVCPYEKQSQDTRRTQIENLRAQIKSKALLQVRLPLSQGGCVNPDETAPTKNESAILDWVGQYSYRNDPRWKREICYAKIIESLAFKAVSKSFSLDDLKNVFEEIRAILIAKVKENVKGSAEIESLQTEMIHELSRIQLITADRMIEWAEKNVNPDPNSLTYPSPAMPLSNPDGGMCGTDFMRRNLFASSTGYKNVHTGMLAVVVCPGQLLEMLNTSSDQAKDSLYQVLGHEMGHHIHAVRNRPAEGHVLPDGTPMTTNFVPAYPMMISCLKDNYENLLSKIDPGSGLLEKVLGRKLTSLDPRLAEITADYWGNQVVTEKVKQLGDSSRSASLIKSAYQRLCYGSTGTRWIEDSSTHPSGRFRIEMIARSKTVREILGCQNTSSNDVANGKPLCTFEGSEN